MERGANQAGNEIVRGAHESGPDKPEDHRVGVDGPEPAENQPRHIPVQAEIGRDHR